jgi:hypothetical protein
VENAQLFARGAASAVAASHGCAGALMYSCSGAERRRVALCRLASQEVAVKGRQP